MAGLLSLLFPRRGSPRARDPAPSATASDGGRVPNPTRLRRERRELMRRREEAIRDVGGLAVEMFRRDRFRHELLLERCGDVVEIEERVHEIDALLAAAATAPHGIRGMSRCRCGAPLPRGAHFCSHCGRAAPETPAVAACAHCGQPLPADTNFCPSCGNPAADDLGEAAGEDEATRIEEALKPARTDER